MQLIFTSKIENGVSFLILSTVLENCTPARRAYSIITGPLTVSRYIFVMSPSNRCDRMPFICSIKLCEL